MQAGTGRNVVPSSALLKVETRGESEAINQYVFERAQHVVAGAAAMYEARYELRMMGAATASAPSPAWVDYLREQAARVPGVQQAVDRIAAPAGSEDATLMMARVQARGGLASYMIFGTELSAGHHNEKFDFDESVMAVAVETLARVALNSPGSGGVMEAIFQFVDEVVEAQRDTYCAIADDIWDHPETRFEEFWSAQRLADALEAEGFQLTRDAGGIPNAFIASVGEGQPVIALLGEFDALAGLSQQAHSAEPTPLTPGANGHGCGHNLLGTAAFAAAVAAKGWLQQHGDSGTLRFTVVPARKAVREKPLWCAKGCLMMSMRR